MAKLSIVVRQKKRQKLVEKYAKKRADLKKTGDYLKLDRMPKDTSSVRLKNRCFLTGRSRGYLRTFGISRIVFRDFALMGKLPGVIKASW